MSTQRLTCSAALVLACLLFPSAWATQVEDDPVQVVRAKGLNFTRPVTVKFEWKLHATPAAEAKVKQLLQAEGFAWARAEATESGSSQTSLHISASKSGNLNEASLSQTIRSIRALTAGEGTSSWSFAQAQ